LIVLAAPPGGSCGIIYSQTEILSPRSDFIVQNAASLLNIIIPHFEESPFQKIKGLDFEEYPLQKIKRLDFEDFKTAI